MTNETNKEVLVFKHKTITDGVREVERFMKLLEKRKALLESALLSKDLNKSQIRKVKRQLRDLRGRILK